MQKGYWWCWAYWPWWPAKEAQAYYNSSTGRWLSRDPVEERVAEPNPNGFVVNCPVNQVDGLGLALYAIDGTWTRAWNQANPWQFYDQTKEVRALYWRGPVDGPTGLDSFYLASKVHKQICQDFCEARKSDSYVSINLTGWSRGAIVAMGVANMLNFPGCRCDGSGACGSIFGTRYLRIQVNWVGLFDAVSQTPMLWWVPHQVPPNVLRFDHAVKTAKDQPWYPTYHFDKPTEKAFDQKNGSPTSHADIGMSEILGNNDAYDWIKSQAIANRVAF